MLVHASRLSPTRDIRSANVAVIGGAYREKHAEDEPPLELSERARLRELSGKSASSG